ncbi:penicillin acylase family protein [Hymenobacter humi]|uniref:Penicillin acylase family protein n=1 Tax=Hymenobacter humi TaxID=1411620 RepID=A0ABW2TZP5_9BACT
MVSWIKALLALAVGLTLVWTLNTKQGDVPPFGKLLSPYRGFWQNGEAQGDFPAEQTLGLAGLRQPVTVRYDDHRVPHVFAQNDQDLYFAQGYLTARDRLWQMEFQTHVAAGRLAEIVGPARLETDRFFRRMGLPFGAANSLKVMMANPTTRTVLESYSAGVNAYINQAHPPRCPSSTSCSTTGPSLAATEVRAAAQVYGLGPERPHRRPSHEQHPAQVRPGRHQRPVSGLPHARRPHRAGGYAAGFQASGRPTRTPLI